MLSWHLQHSSYWPQWSCLRMGLQPILEWLYCCQWELCRKRHRSVDGKLTLTLGVNGPSNSQNYSNALPFMCYSSQIRCFVVSREAQECNNLRCKLQIKLNKCESKRKTLKLKCIYGSGIISIVLVWVLQSIDKVLSSLLQYFLVAKYFLSALTKTLPCLMWLMWFLQTL